jgi:hypothetical protein
MTASYLRRNTDGVAASVVLIISPSYSTMSASGMVIRKAFEKKGTLLPSSVVFVSHKRPGFR